MKFKVIQKANDLEVSCKIFDSIKEATDYYFSLNEDLDKYIIPIKGE